MSSATAVCSHNIIHAVSCLYFCTIFIYKYGRVGTLRFTPKRSAKRSEKTQKRERDFFCDRRWVFLFSSMWINVHVERQDGREYSSLYIKFISGLSLYNRWLLLKKILSTSGILQFVSSIENFKKGKVFFKVFCSLLQVRIKFSCASLDFYYRSLTCFYVPL